MDPLYLKAILAGLCFGLWPLFMNKSGLNSVEASAALSLFFAGHSDPISSGQWGSTIIDDQMADGAPRLPIRCTGLTCA